MSAALEDSSSSHLVTLKEGMSALYNVGGKSFNFGLQIGLSYDQLEKTQSCDDKIRELLRERLKDGDLTWETVVKALKDSSVNKPNLAKEIQRKYVESSTQQVSGTEANSQADRQHTHTTGPGKSTPKAARQNSTSTDPAQSVGKSSKPSTSGTRKRKSDGGEEEASKHPRSADYYDESMFVNQNTLNKYRCMHCARVAKTFFQCKCGKTSKDATKGNGKSKNEEKGLSCGDCKNKGCKNCGKNDQYKSSRAIDGNIRKLKVYCSNKDRGCDKKFTLNELKNHLKTCSVPCKYQWAGCNVVEAGKKLVDHEEGVKVHFELFTSTTKKMLEEMNTRIECLERKLSDPNQRPTP